VVTRAATFACAALALTLWAAAVSAQTQVSCKVLDPELQGSYSGGCAGGYAQGHGEAHGTAIYRGEFVAGRKHGKGVKIWPATGDRYEGEFVADRKEGIGTYVWGDRSASAGERYSGGYLADRRDGRGVYEWPDGDRYEGPWKADMPTGKPTSGMVARARAQAERAAAVGVPGVRVCRELKVGIATLDRIRGIVLSRHDDSVRVRIEDAGRIEHTIDGRLLRKGDVLKTPLRVWTPCL
jgi:hypothetical protein